MAKRTVPDAGILRPPIGSGSGPAPVASLASTRIRSDPVRIERHCPRELHSVTAANTQFQSRPDRIAWHRLRKPHSVTAANTQFQSGPGRIARPRPGEPRSVTVADTRPRICKPRSRFVVRVVRMRHGTKNPRIGHTHVFPIRGFEDAVQVRRYHGKML